MGSPNIIICYTDVVDDDSKEQSAYKAFQKDVEVVAQNTLGRNSQHLRTIPLPKNYSPSTNKNVEWYKGPTLLEMIDQSNQFLPPLTRYQALAKPSYVRFEGYGDKLFLTTAGVTESKSHGLTMPYTPWTGAVSAMDEMPYRYSPSLQHFLSPYKLRPGNCLVSIAVVHNTLRNHFENEIYLLGLKRYIHIHLLLENKDGKVNFLEQVYPGENCLAVATITTYNVTTYKAPEDPKHKLSLGKFIANDHHTEVFYGVVLKFDKDHVGDFFEGDKSWEYNRPNALRARRKQVIEAKEAERKERVRAQRVLRKAQKRKDTENKAKK
jgi:hypothetical protein